MISEVIGSVRAGNVGARPVHASGAWGMRYDAFAGSGFHILTRGDAWLITRNEEPVALTAGDVVLSPSGAAHGLSHAPCGFGELPPAVMAVEPPPVEPSDVEFLCGAYRLDRGRAHHYLRAMPDVVAVSPDYDRHPELRSLIGLLGADTAADRPGTRATRSALLDLLLVHVLRLWLEDEGGVTWPALDDPVVSPVLREMHASPEKPWTVQRLSASSGLSRTAFTRRFTAVVGEPPMTYLMNWRLDRGARLLRETSSPLATIARQVGYATEFAFAGAFRREYGVSPGRFRKSV
ncbi:AraC family transcriptional regulator [Actinoplanes palleronii]|nr:AraC family transcriptional regulator [Actinoplanes palleronii]